MANSLSIPHSQQIEDGYCLPACAQMALVHLGISRSQENLGRTLKIRKGFGVPASTIVNLSSRELDVVYQTGGTLDVLRNWMQKGIPVITCVQAGELPHWQKINAQHAVLVVGLDEVEVYIHDPALPQGIVAVSVGDFLLAWDEMEYRYAVIVRRV